MNLNQSQILLKDFIGMIKRNAKINFYVSEIGIPPDSREIILSETEDNIHIYKNKEMGNDTSNIFYVDEGLLKISFNEVNFNRK